MNNRYLSSCAYVRCYTKSTRTVRSIQPASVHPSTLIVQLIDNLPALFSMPPRVLGLGPSCNECRRRKIKCDRSIPCSYCVRTRIQCVYPESAFETGGHEGITDRIEGVEKRLQSLEQGISDIKSLLQMSLAGQHSAKDVEGFQPSSANKRPVVIDRTPDVEMSSELQADPIIPGPKQPVFLSTISLPVLGSLHPPPATVIILWQRFMDNIDPLLKLFHTPSLQRQIVNAINALDRVEPYTECQMFAIYYCTIVEMSPEDCQYILGEQKKTLLDRYEL